jgi:bifunctional DNA-binding transcriptional regulator/antitoxin component of YhaV-PrlF toxin-antitoxin module
MSSIVTTITSKWQVTIPEEVRKELPLEIGQRIAWEVQGDKLVGRKVRSIRELAGCLGSSVGSGNREGSSGEFAKAAMARHNRISKQKP